MDFFRKGDRPFVDDVHFPRGFNRSGDFSINDAMLLKDYGTTMKQLYGGELLPDNEAEKRFIQVANGSLEPVNSLEKVWLKYLSIINTRTFHTLNSRAKDSSSRDYEFSEYSEEL